MTTTTCKSENAVSTLLPGYDEWSDMVHSQVPDPTPETLGIVHIDRPFIPASARSAALAEARRRYGKRATRLYFA